MKALPKTINISWRELLRDQDIMLGDTFVVPIERVRSCQSRLNQFGYGTKREPCSQHGSAIVRVVEFSTTKTNRELYIKELRRLTTKQLGDVVAACRQNGLIK
jgi:hypothetical protein